MESTQQSAPASFLRRIRPWIRNSFVVIGVLTTLAFLFVGRALIQYSKPSLDPVLASGENAILHFNLRGQIAEGSQGQGMGERLWSQILGKPVGPYVLDVKASLEQAAKDPHIKGIFLEINDLAGSLVSFAELRQTFAQFQASDKPIYAWLADGSNDTYYLATVAKEVYLPPGGEMMIPGPSFQLPFFGDALRKLGIEFQVVKAGRYKSAMEPFLLNRPSPDSLVMYEALEKSVRQSMVQAIAESRHVDNPSKVDGWLAESIFTAQAAKAQGLVDDLLYPEAAKDKVAQALGGKMVDFERYAEQQSSPGLSLATSSENGIALIEATGEIHMYARGDEEAIVPERMIKQLIWARDEKTVKAVVLRISSPGGSAAASDLIWDEVRQLAAKKPVVVSMGAYAASGGYYIAAPATKIFAAPTTLTGSIGVFGMLANLHAFEEKYGISFHIVSQSKRRDMLSPGRQPSAEDKEVLAGTIAAIYDDFLAKVAAGRSMSVEQVDQVAQGRVWTGAQAKEIGLVDEIGGLFEAMQEAKRLANLDPSIKVPVLRWQPPIRSLSDCLRNMSECFPAGASLSSRHGLAFATSGLATDGLASLKVLRRLENWGHYVQTEPVQAIWPGYFGQQLAR